MISYIHATTTLLETIPRLAGCVLCGKRMAPPPCYVMRSRPRRAVRDCLQAPPPQHTPKRETSQFNPIQLHMMAQTAEGGLVDVRRTSDPTGAPRKVSLVIHMCII